MRTYIWKGVIYNVTEEEFQDLISGWVRPQDLFG